MVGSGSPSSMPRRAPPPNRLACEAVLSDAERIMLRDQAAAFGVPEERWHLVPALSTVWATLAAVRKAEKLRSGSELPMDRAIAIESRPLGLNAETIRSRLRSFYRQSRGL